MSAAPVDFNGERAGVIVCGPPGSGKTRHAEALRCHYGLQHVMDDEAWQSGDAVPAGTLVLTQAEDPRAIPIDAALTALRSSAPSAP